MWQCDNCGYTDENGTTFEEELDPESGENVRYCPECGSDEVYQVDEDDEPEANDLYDDEDSDDGDDEGDGEWGEEEEREDW